MKKNQGYTMIELIIVIAIIAIMTGFSFGTIAVIKKARYNTAASTLSNQIGSLNVKTRAISEAKNNPLCILLHKNSDKIDLDDGSVLRANSYSLILGYDAGSSIIDKKTGVAFAEASTKVVEASLPNIVEVVYTPSDAAQQHGCNDDDNIVIEFNKSSGGVRYGAGKYELVYNNRTVATVTLDATTGNHYLK